MHSIDLPEVFITILDRYKAYLGQMRDEVVKRRFDLQYDNNQEAAISEALVFNWLCSQGQNPALNEDISRGGADFICRPSREYSYIVEVTCIGSKALTEETGCHMVPGQHMYISSPTRLLRQKVTDKARQLSGYEIPTVLVITSLHNGAYILLSPKEAVNFLISDYAYTIPLEGSPNDTYFSTDLKQSIFFKRNFDDPSDVLPCRQSISAVLLMPISGDRLNAVGILHPEPRNPFSIHALKKVPFVRVQYWPIKDEVFTEWVISEPYAAVYPHSVHIDVKNT